MIRKKPIKFKHFAQTLLLIIEDGTKASFSEGIYCLLILVLFCQIAGYIFNNYESKPLHEHNIVYFAHWMEYAPGTFLLFISAKDTLTLFFFGVFQLVLYSYLLYLVSMTFIRRWSPRTLTQIAPFKNAMNAGLRLFFSLFLWIFYIPFTEIHAGVAVCGNNSFLLEYRSADGCSKKPAYQTLLGWLGVVLTFFTGCLLNYVFVNYDFRDKNLLKRRFRPNLILQILFRTILISLYYLDINNVILIKHFCSHVIGILVCYDYVRFFPFKNKTVSIVYGSCCFIFEGTMTIFSLWELTDYYPEYNLFYMWFLIIPMGFAITINIWNRKYENFMTINMGIPNNQSLELLDHFLEELHHLAEKSQISQISKLRLLGTFENHMRSCKNHACPLQKDTPLGNYLDSNSQVDKVKVIQIINSFFTAGLNNEFFKYNPAEREFISLKFYTFLSNFQDNPVRAYYELKSMLHKEKKKENASSLLFRLLSKIISQNIEALIIQYLEQSGGGSTSTRTFSIRSEYLNSISLHKFLNFKTEFVKKFRVILKKKIQFWENLLKGFDSLETASRQLIEMVTNIVEIRDDYQSHCKELDSNLADKENIIYLKMLSLFNLTVLNDVITAHKVENKIFDIKKRDSVTAKENLTSLSIIRGDSVVLIASLLEETGKIISARNENQASLFGYDKTDFSLVSHVNQLMPPSMSEIHSKIIMRYVKTGKSVVIRNSRNVFAVDKAKFMFPVKLFLNNIFDFSTDFALAATITRLETSCVNILCDRHGNIDGISRNFYEALGLVPDKIHQIILTKCNILLLIPKLFERLNLKELERNMSERDHYVDLLVNERLELLIPNDFKSYCEGFQRDPSVKTLKTKWKNKKYLRAIETYIGDMDRETHLNRKSIILSLRSRYIGINEEERRTFYYIEITEIYSENTTSTFMTHNTFAVTMSRNESSKDEYVLMNSVLKSPNNKSTKEAKAQQISLIPVREDEKLENSVELVPKNIGELRASNDIEPQVSSSASIVLGGEPNRRDDDPPKSQEDQLEESMLVPKDFPLESRRNPIKPVDFYKPDLKEDESFDPRHEESLPMFERPLPGLSVPSLLKDEKTAEKYRETNLEEQGGKRAAEHISEDEEESSSGGDDKANKNKEGLLKNVSRSKTNRSDAFTKRLNEDDERAFQRSVHSSSSMRTTYGSAFIKDILNNFKYPRLLTKIKIIATIEILCFLATNIMYLILIQNRLTQFEDKVERMAFSGSLSKAYTRELMDLNFKYLMRENIINNITEFDLNILYKIGDDAHADFKDFLFFKQDFEFYTQYREKSQTVFRFQDGQKVRQNLEEYDFYDLLLKSLYDVYLVPLEAEKPTVNLDEYLFWRVNYLESTQASEFLITKYLSIGDSDRDAVASFYLVISVVGLSLAIVLQLLNLPFLSEFFKYIQKLILIITRITQDECRLEIGSLKKYESMLASTTDDFLAEDFLNSEEHETTKRRKEKVVDNAKSKRVNSNYLSSKIGVHKIRSLPKYLTIVLLILIVTLYFMGLLIYLNTIQKQLNFSVDISRSFTTFARNVNNVLCEFNILLTSQFLSEKEYLTENDIEGVFNHFQSELSNLNSFRVELVRINTQSEVPESQREALSYLLNNNLCNSQYITYCSDTTDNVFRAGVLGFISYIVSEGKQATDQFLLREKLSLENIKPFFTGTRLRDRIIATYSFRFLRVQMIDLLKEIHSINVQSIKDTLIIIFSIGGLGSSLILVTFLVILFRKIKRDLLHTRMSLLLIPNKKLSEDTVIYLLKNIENI